MLHGSPNHEGVAKSLTLGRWRSLSGGCTPLPPPPAPLGMDGWGRWVGSHLGLRGTQSGGSPLCDLPLALACVAVPALALAARVWPHVFASQAGRPRLRVLVPA